MAGIVQYRKDITKHFEFLGYTYDKGFDMPVVMDSFMHPHNGKFTLLYGPTFIVIDQSFLFDEEIDAIELNRINLIYYAKCIYYDGMVVFRMLINHYEKVNFGRIMDNFIFEVEEISKEIATM